MIYRYAARCVNSLPLSNGRWSLFVLYIYIYILFFFLFFLVFVKYFFLHFFISYFVSFVLFLFICRWRFSSYETLMQYVNASCYLRIIKCIGWNICHVYSVCAYFLNSSNKSCEIILYQLLIVYISMNVYTFLTCRIDFLVRWYLYFAAILPLTTAHPPQNDRVRNIRSRWQIYWSPLFRTRTQLYQSYKLLDLLELPLKILQFGSESSITANR